MHHLLLSALDLAPGAPSRQRQLLERLRQAILDGRLAPGSRLPSSRTLCEELQVSRNTVLAVYEQLIAEGYAQADRQGTRVAQLGPRPSHPAPPTAALPAPRASRRVASMSPARDAGDRSLPLTPGMPALARFPVNAWLRAQERALRAASPQVLGYGDPLGEPALREAIAQYLGVARGVRCDASRIVVTEGAQGALSLCVRLFANAGDLAWMEDPGYGGARAAFQAGDLKVVGMPVDAEGIAIPARAWRGRAPRLIHVTPSHQYPCGAVLSLARRLELIAQARSKGSWIIEDDYDSDFRHRGHPVVAMQGLVADAPVLYVGTFSKTMFPALRIGFLVLPQSSAVRAVAALGELLRGGHRLEQLALAEFIASGQFSRHLGRMRRLYRERQQALRAALASCLGVEHEVLGGDAGLHLTIRLPAGVDDRAVSAAARAKGMNVGALSSFASPASTSTANGLVLGYGNTSAEQFAPLMRHLARIVKGCTR
ncbi:PLP-dependent aminotransferase family protein [Herbaspirillum sp. YR522]|uniref:MocR-like pyridoxine biosynthesis transcription factor PdxR n=1 Tax=Herbaspirillum sp. YR522 TaxID=1144342 RepID=UPI00026F7FC1|nr:PLP-dependent aminotransferase family protein [Herbaspirillum sp. YR522]EJN00953.1 transcriptional regulator with HTH domain and aminotransferase domain containing protein [Herbaspirillum sp. YR522]